MKKFVLVALALLVVTSVAMAQYERHTAKLTKVSIQQTSQDSVASSTATFTRGEYKDRKTFLYGETTVQLEPGNSKHEVRIEFLGPDGKFFRGGRVEVDGSRWSSDLGVMRPGTYNLLFLEMRYFDSIPDDYHWEETTLATAVLTITGPEPSAEDLELNIEDREHP